MRRLLVAATVLVLTASAAPARAASVAVTMQGLKFTPRVAYAHIGDTVNWSNAATDRHSTTSAAPTPWDSEPVNPWGGKFARVFPIAGAFPYYCTIHHSLGMTGTVEVATKVAPASGTPATTFTATLASAGVKPPAGYVFVLQRAIGSGAFSTIASTSAAAAAFKPGAVGTYKLRSGLQKLSAAVNTAWFGDPVTITVR